MKFLIPFDVYYKIGSFIPTATQDFCKDQNFLVKIEYDGIQEKPSVNLIINGAPVNAEIGHVCLRQDDIVEHLCAAKFARFSEELKFWLNGNVLTSYEFSGDTNDITLWKANLTWVRLNGEIRTITLQSPSFYAE